MGHCPTVLYSCLQSDLAPFTDGLSSRPPDASVKTVASLALLSSFMKKFMDEPAAQAEERAVNKFLEINASLKGFTPSPETLTDEYLLGEFRDVFRKFVDNFVLDKLNQYDLYRYGRTGPGASVGAYGFDFYTKLYASPLTCTSESIFRLYKAAMVYDTRGVEAELIRDAHYSGCTVVAGNNLSCVPKSRDIARTICTEPTLNMYFQLGLGRILEEGLVKSFGICLSRQPDRNRRMAHLGSIDGSFCTIDLASASDTISLGLCEWLIPTPLLGWLKLLRSPKSKIRGEWVDLNMVSTMGNGFTFPLQTLIFACVVASAYTLSSVKLAKPRQDQDGNFGVFGDDIICTKETYYKVVRLLTLLGFKVNEEKSFNVGDFRESCGRDFFKGHDVRGVYCKTLKTTQARLAVINRLLEWEATHDIRLRRTLHHLLSNTAVNYVPRHAGYDEGLRVPFNLVTRRKLDPNTWGWVYYRWGQQAPSLSCDGDNQVISASTSEHRDARKRGKKERRRIFNAPGLILSLLHGSLRDGKISISPKGDLSLYRRKRSVTSRWDGRPDGWQPPDPQWEQRWERAVGRATLR